MEFDFICNSEKIKVKIELKKRKTIKIYIRDIETICVLSPYFLDKEKIISIVEEKRAWIEKHMKFYRENLESYSHREYINGERFLYLGDKYYLFVENNVKNRKVFIDKTNKKLHVVTPKVEPKYIKNLLEIFYTQQTMQEVRQALNKFQPYFNKRPIDIIIKNQKTRWGSCTYKNKILLNFRICMASREVLEYIVLHEMCHMVHKNHSKDFWNLVRKIMPDYQRKALWLKENGEKMNV